LAFSIHKIINIDVAGQQYQQQQKQEDQKAIEQPSS